MCLGLRGADMSKTRTVSVLLFALGGVSPRSLERDGGRVREGRNRVLWERLMYGVPRAMKGRTRAHGS